MTQIASVIFFTILYLSVIIFLYLTNIYINLIKIVLRKIYRQTSVYGHAIKLSDLSLILQKPYLGVILSPPKQLNLSSSQDEHDFISSILSSSE
jgi:hypothetical protein